MANENARALADSFVRTSGPVTAIQIAQHVAKETGLSYRSAEWETGRYLEDAFSKGSIACRGEHHVISLLPPR